jgi:vacuolar-type H+-ATPase subunit F/Vma7
VTSAALADGFRLGGCLTIVATPGAVAAAALRDVAATGDVGLLLVTTDLWTSVEERLRGQLERLARPVVLPIPVGAVGDARARGRLLGEMLQRAVGYRIELALGGSPGSRT